MERLLLDFGQGGFCSYFLSWLSIELDTQREQADEMMGEAFRLTPRKPILSATLSMFGAILQDAYGDRIKQALVTEPQMPRPESEGDGYVTIPITKRFGD